MAKIYNGFTFAIPFIILPIHVSDILNIKISLWFFSLFVIYKWIFFCESLCS